MEERRDPTIRPPRLSRAEAQELARSLFGVSAEATPLPSERDQNFRLDTTAGPALVLKIANAAETHGVLDAQNAVLSHLAERDPSLGVPRVRATLTGESIATGSSREGPTHYVRLLSYVPGHPFVEAAPHPPELLESLGSFLGRLDRAMAGFTRPALKRYLEWDLYHASSVVAQNLVCVEDPDRRALIERFLGRFQEEVEPTLPHLRMGVIHNDANDHNLLVTDLYGSAPEVTGIVDFGDVVESCTLFELAIGLAYAILDAPDPIFAGAEVVRGYHRVWPLSEEEVALLAALMTMRLCTSVVIAAARKLRHADNPYLAVSEGPAWRALEAIEARGTRLFTYAFRAACGLPACPRTASVVDWLEHHVQDIGRVVDADLRSDNVHIFDLGPDSVEFAGMPDSCETDEWSRVLFARIRDAGAAVGIGRYAEARRCYTAATYRGAAGEVETWRTVHLGIDLFLPPGSPVFAPLPGTVHSLRNNARPLDYGPTLILRHNLPDLGECFTLYGHLTSSSLEGVSKGQAYARGDRIGRVGDSSENGGWSPHLHFQLIVDLLEWSGDFPGTCTDRGREVWMSLSPDPNLILRIPDLTPSTQGRGPRALRDARARHLGPSLHVSYKKPLKLVSGRGAYVFDHLGRAYLDTPNNVAHVGHGHPHVVQSAARQLALLNTNTRYLHDHLVDYAERLCAKLPDPLEIVYFVCSGSEANELALRLAFAYTGARDMIVVEGGYHGNTTLLTEISSYKFDAPGGQGAPSNVHKVSLPDRYRGRYRGPEAGPLYVREIDETVNALGRRGIRPAALLCESMLSCGGQIVPPPGYLASAYEAVRLAGGLCIADEVQVGFGRVGTHFWGFELQGVTPDIVTMGKPMGNGFPLAAVVTTRGVAEAFAPGMDYFNTFGGSPVACAVGLAVLEVIEQEGLQQNALEVGTHLKHALGGLMERHSVIGDVRGEGLFLGIELVRDRESRNPTPEATAYVAERMKDLGVLIGIDGLSRNVLKIKPPMVVTSRDAAYLTEVLDRVLAEPRLKTLLATRQNV